MRKKSLGARDCRCRDSIDKLLIRLARRGSNRPGSQIPCTHGLTVERGGRSKRSPGLQAQASQTFHVKHHHRGRFEGIPVGRGNLSGVAPHFTMTWNEADDRNDPRDSKPRLRRPSGSQREASCSHGGSDTIRTPPTTRKRVAHSAVTAGLPNDRETTSSKDESSRESRDASSLRSHMTSAKWGASGHPSTSRRNAVLFSIASRRVTCVRHCCRSTRPGTPPPLPRSSHVPGMAVDNSSHARINPSA